ncbi:MAG: hypothetical protein U0V02_11240 [Anaerolineales bacterium]
MYEFHYGVTVSSLRISIPQGATIATTTGTTFAPETFKVPICNSCVSKKVKRNNFLYSIRNNIYYILAVVALGAPIGFIFWEDFFQFFVVVVIIPLFIVFFTVQFPAEKIDMKTMGSKIAITVSKEELSKKGFDYLCTSNEYSRFLIVPSFFDISEMEKTKNVGKLIDTLYQFGFPTNKNYIPKLASMACDSLGRIGSKKDIQSLETLKSRINSEAFIKLIYSPETVKFIDNAISLINKRENS